MMNIMKIWIDKNIRLNINFIKFSEFIKFSKFNKWLKIKF